MGLVLCIIVFSILFLVVASVREIVRKRRLLAFFHRLNCDELHLVAENAAEIPNDQPGNRPTEIHDEAPLDAISAGSRIKTVYLSPAELADRKGPYARMMKLAGIQKLPCKIRYEKGLFIGEFTGKRNY